MALDWLLKNSQRYHLVPPAVNSTPTLKSMTKRNILSILSFVGLQWHNGQYGLGFAHGYQHPNDVERAYKSMGLQRKRRSRYNPFGLFGGKKMELDPKGMGSSPPQTPAPKASQPRFLANDDDDNVELTNELCSEYLISFLEGTTDAKDNCDGILNAYIAADCASLVGEKEVEADDDHDDYMGGFYAHFCCSSLKIHYYEYCDEEDYISNWNLLVIMSVMLLCECAKSFIKKNKLNFLPEAGGCILVGTMCGFIAHVALGFNIDALSFDNELFLCVLLPPIIFEAALSVNKREFRRHRLAILMFAIVGTLFSTFVTGIMVHYASAATDSSPTLPMLESITFGALISSIDPVAILSVLSSLGMGEKDTIFIIVFGESLLNDGIAITLFKSLVACFNDTDGTIEADQVLGVIADFIIVCFGSVAIGIACGALAVMYFWVIGRILHPSMEVGSFFIWALIPYYICDAIEWSGIVAIVAMGFFMDIYITPKRKKSAAPTSLSMHIGMGGDIRGSFDIVRGSFEVASFDGSETQNSSSKRAQVTNILIRRKRVRLSAEADRHVRFVAHLMATLAENAIFAYLGLFLLSSNYDWDVFLLVVSIVSCVMGRILMVLVICWSIWHIHILRQRFCWQGGVKTASEHNRESSHKNVLISNTVATIQEWRSQLVLVLSGLRGAVSMVLVENIPIYNGVTGQGSEFKPQLKAMTSAAIIFTMFIFGGSSYYILRKLGVTSDGTEDDDASKSGQDETAQGMRDTPETKSAYRNPMIADAQQSGIGSSESGVSVDILASGRCIPCVKDVVGTSNDNGVFMSPLQETGSELQHFDLSPSSPKESYSTPYVRYRSKQNEMINLRRNSASGTRTSSPTSSVGGDAAITDGPDFGRPITYTGGVLSPVNNSVAVPIDSNSHTFRSLDYDGCISEANRSEIQMGTFQSTGREGPRSPENTVSHGDYESIDGTANIAPFHLRPNTYPASGRPGANSHPTIYPASGRPSADVYPATYPASGRPGADPYAASGRSGADTYPASGIQGADSHPPSGGPV